jgi:hypothetical protein
MSMGQPNSEQFLQRVSHNQLIDSSQLSGRASVDPIRRNCEVFAPRLSASLKRRWAEKQTVPGMSKASLS